MDKNWLNVYTKLVENFSEINNISCPNCRQKSIDFQYVGDKKKRIGYMAIWCTSCLRGIHISRVKIPDVVDFISFDQPTEEVAKRIPNFKQI